MKLSKGSKMGRNTPCPCGSGIKYKKCCLNKEQERQFKIRKEIENVKQRDEEKNEEKEIVQDSVEESPTSETRNES